MSAILAYVSWFPESKKILSLSIQKWNAIGQSLEPNR